MLIISVNGISFASERGVQHIPADVLIKIFQKLDFEAFKKLQLVSKSCYQFLSRKETLRRLSPFRLSLHDVNCFMEVDHLFRQIYSIIDNKIVLSNRNDLKVLYTLSRKKGYFLRDPQDKYPLQIEMEEVLRCALHHFPKGSWLDTCESTLNVLRASRRVCTIIESHTSCMLELKSFRSEEALRLYQEAHGLDIAKKVAWYWKRPTSLNI
jgi:hypothetical protein